LGPEDIGYNSFFEKNLGQTFNMWTRCKWCLCGAVGKRLGSPIILPHKVLASYHGPGGPSAEPQGKVRPPPPGFRLYILNLRNK